MREQARLDAEERREERRLSLRMLAAAEAAGHAAITALFRGRRIHRSPDRCRTQASGQDILKNPEVAVLNPECRAPSVKGVPRQLQKTVIKMHGLQNTPGEKRREGPQQRFVPPPQRVATSCPAPRIDTDLKPALLGQVR